MTATDAVNLFAALIAELTEHRVRGLVKSLYTFALGQVTWFH